MTEEELEKLDLLKGKELSSRFEIIDYLIKKIKILEAENERLNNKLKQKEMPVSYNKKDNVVYAISGSIGACAPNAKIIRR